jgi:hypothetical protein
MELAVGRLKLTTVILGSKFIPQKSIELRQYSLYRMLLFDECSRKPNLMSL